MVTRKSVLPTGVTSSSKAILKSALPRIRAIAERYTSGPLPEWDTFARTLRVIRFQQSEVVEQNSNTFLIVLGGLIKEVHDSPSIRGQTSEFFSAGSVIATRLEPSWARTMTTPFSVVAQKSIGPKIPPMTAYAIKPSIVLSVNWEVIDRLAAVHPEWGQVQVSLLWTYIEEQYSVILQLREKDLQVRYLTLVERPDLENRLTQRDIAAYLGITESALSRFLRRMRGKTEHPPMGTE